MSTLDIAFACTYIYILTSLEWVLVAVDHENVLPPWFSVKFIYIKIVFLLSLNKILHKNNFNLKSFFLTSIKDKVAYFSHCKLNSGMQILWYRGYWQTSSYSESQIPALFLFIAPWHVWSRVPYMKLGLFSIILGVFVRILLTCDFKSKISLWVRWHNKESWSMIAMVSLFRWLFTHDNVKVRNICDKNTKEFFPCPKQVWDSQTVVWYSHWKRIGVNSQFHDPIPILWDWVLECLNNRSEIGAATPRNADFKGFHTFEFPSLYFAPEDYYIVTFSSPLFFNFFS